MTSDASASRSLGENPYADRIEGQILTYTAAGREGDQALTGRNKRLIQQYESPVPIFGFSNMGQQRYRFLGLLELVRHYRDTQRDAKGGLRTVWMFEFFVHTSPPVVEISVASDVASSVLASRVVGITDREVASNDSGADHTEYIRAHLLAIPPRELEFLVAELFVRCGFVDVRTTAFQGDGGIDVDAHLSMADTFFSGTHVQAQVKRWRHAVGSVELNAFRGALASTAKGVFVTTGYFTRAAMAESQSRTKPSIALLDGRRFSELCLDKKLVRREDAQNS